jgi:phosphoglycerate dehydrogenase-like enzyme
VAIGTVDSTTSQPLAVYTDWDEIDVTPGRRKLEAAGWSVRLVGSTDANLIADAAARATALCVGYATVDAPLLGRLPSLRIVATLSAGYDMVDVHAATRRGVWVANLPDVATEEVASHALAMVLALVRRLPALDRGVRAGRWTLDVDEPPRTPRDMTLALLGLGRIGRRVAELAIGLFGTVIASDPAVASGVWPRGVDRVELGELVARADVLSLHLPAAPGSPPIVTAELLEALPDGAFLINVSRGGLVDHEALARALDAGRLAGAALDVLDREPPTPDHPLMDHPRVLLSPHTAFLSDRTLVAYPEGQAENVLAWQRRGRPLTPVAQPS